MLPSDSLPQGPPLSQEPTHQGTFQNPRRLLRLLARSGSRGQTSLPGPPISSAWPRPRPAPQPPPGLSLIHSFCLPLASSKPAGPALPGAGPCPCHPLVSLLSPLGARPRGRGLLQSILLTHPAILRSRPHCHPYFAYWETEALGRKARSRTDSAVGSQCASSPDVPGSCCPAAAGPAPAPEERVCNSGTSQKAEACRQLTVPGLRP